MPDFTTRRMMTGDVRSLCQIAGIEVRLVRMHAAACAPPLMCGQPRHIYLSSYLPASARPFVLLHELAHIVAGHAEELEQHIDKYPFVDRVADGVAALGVTIPDERRWGAPDLQSRLLELVPVEGIAWTQYRSLDVAMFLRFWEER